MELSRLQTTMRVTYLERDAARGGDATFRWLTEEVGELAKARLQVCSFERIQHKGECGRYRILRLGLASSRSSRYARMT